MFVRFSLAAIAAAGLVVSAAQADPLRDAAESAAACRTIAADADRLTCLDAAALALSSALGQAPVAAEAPAVPEEPKWAAAPEVKAPKAPAPAPVVAAAPTTPA